MHLNNIVTVLCRKFGPFSSESHSTVLWLASPLISISTAKDTGLCVKPFNVLNWYLLHQPHWLGEIAQPSGTWLRLTVTPCAGYWCIRVTSVASPDAAGPGRRRLLLGVQLLHWHAQPQFKFWFRQPLAGRSHWPPANTDRVWITVNVFVLPSPSTETRNLKSLALATKLEMFKLTWLELEICCRYWALANAPSRCQTWNPTAIFLETHNLKKMQPVIET